MSLALSLILTTTRVPVTYLTPTTLAVPHPYYALVVLEVQAWSPISGPREYRPFP